MIPSCDHVGTPRGFDDFFHLHSSTTSGSACLIKTRKRPSSSPRQSVSSRILASTSLEADWRDADSVFCGAFDFTMGTCLPLELLLLAWVIRGSQWSSIPDEPIGAPNEPRTNGEPLTARVPKHRGWAVRDARASQAWWPLPLRRFQHSPDESS